MIKNTNKKAISPVVATALLLIVAVVAVVGFQNWFGAYSSGVFSNVEVKSDSGSNGLKIENLVGDTLYVSNNLQDNLNITTLKIGGQICNLTNNLTLGMNEIPVSSCVGNLTTSTPDIVLITEKNVVSKQVYVKDASISSSGSLEEGEGGSPSASNFISLWNVSIDAGLTGVNNLELPLQSDGTYDFTVDWGDGNTSYVNSWNSVNKTHTYESGGEYIVTIGGTIEGFAFNAGNSWQDNQDDGDKLIDVLQWGSLKISDGGDQFSNCENLIGFSASDTLNTTGITNMNAMFAYASSFNQPLSFDTSSVNNMRSMFFGASSFNQTLNFDTSSVTTMENMFWGASSFNRPLNFDTSNVTFMNAMFRGASSFNQPLNFDTSSVTTMNNMFTYASSFNQPLNFDTSSVTTMSFMFFDASSFNQPLSFDTSSVTTMENMFYGTSSFNQPLSFDTSNVTDMGSMFSHASIFNRPLNFDTSNVTDMNAMFAHASSFNQPLNFDTSSVTDMGTMFAVASSFNQDISNWCVSLIGSKPTNFDISSGGFAGNDAIQPQWGTCP